MKGSGCFVRTGSQLMYVDEWVRRYSRSESLKLDSLIQSTGSNSIQETVIFLLGKHQANRNTVNKYLALMQSTEGLDDQFQKLMSRVQVCER